MGDNDQNIDKDIAEGFESPQTEGDTRPLSYDASATLKTFDVHVKLEARDADDEGRLAVALRNAGHGDVEFEDGKLDLVITTNSVNEGAAERSVVGGPLLLPILNTVSGWDVETVLRGEAYGDHRQDLNPALETGVGIDGTVDAAQPIGSPAVKQGEDGDTPADGGVTVTTAGEQLDEAARSGQDEARRAEAEKKVADGDDLKTTDEDKDAIADDKAKSDAKAEAIDEGKTEEQADKAAAKAKADDKKKTDDKKKADDKKSK